MDGGDTSKRALRSAVRDARAAIGPAARATASQRAAQRALDLPEVARARAVLAFAALPEEIDPSPLVAALRALGARIALPRVCGPGMLSLHWVAPDEPLERSGRGIDEPPAGCEWASPDDLDLVIVPGVAFDDACARLGFGGGFYDALLPTLPPSASAVAIAFDEQVVEQVPCDDHDARVDVVVTPTRTLRRSDAAPR